MACGHVRERVRLYACLACGPVDMYALYTGMLYMVAYYVECVAYCVEHTALSMCRMLHGVSYRGCEICWMQSVNAPITPESFSTLGLGMGLPGSTIGW